MSSAAPGTPIWVDFSSPDLPVTTSFYIDLFGWTAHPSADPRHGGYTIFQRDGCPVAGAGPLFTEGQPTTWTTYVSTDDADAAAERVEKAGGTVQVAPIDVPEQGRMAVFADPAGAGFAVWQPGGMAGAELFNSPGSLCWNELTTRDPDGAKVFYREVFGWAPHDSQFDQTTYTEWRIDGRSVAGMMPMVGDIWPADLPPHWMVYFAVDDCDAVAERTAQLGGLVSVQPTDIPQGRFAVLSDPHGAAFSVIRLSPELERATG